MKKIQNLIFLGLMVFGSAISSGYAMDKKFSGEEYKDPKEVFHEDMVFDYYTSKNLYAVSQVMSNDPQSKAQQDAELARQKAALPWGLQWLGFLFKNNYHDKDVLSVDDKDTSAILAASISKQVAAQKFYKADFKSDGEKPKFFNEPFVLNKMNKAGAEYKNSEKYYKSRYYGISSQEAAQVVDKYTTKEQVQMQVDRARHLNRCGAQETLPSASVFDDCVNKRNYRLPRKDYKVIFESEHVADLKKNNPVDINPQTNKYAQLFDRVA